MGKNKVTANINAVESYLICSMIYSLRRLFCSEWLALIPKSKKLQDKEPLTNLLNLLQEENQKMAA
jgi:dihydroorotate dehydrogenase